MDDSTRDALPSAFDLGIAGFDGAVAIGRGGFSVVYRAREADLDRDVAIKVLQVNPDDGEWQAFERERRALGALSQHPHVVTVFASGFTADGRPYLSMEYMPGGSLADRIAGGALPWPEAVEVVIKVAGALQAAHDAGVLHRDIKPGNILVSGYGEPKLADFGIARMEDRTETRSGVVSATIEHAAPEVLAGQRPTAVSDVYSLGSTLYALLSGQAPFTRDTDESIAPLLARITTAPVPDLSARGIPAPVSRVLEAALAKDPSQRIQTAEELARRLRAAGTTGDDSGERAISDDRATTADTLSPRAAPRRRGLKRRIAIATAIAILGVAGLTVAAVVALGHDDQTRSAGATSTSTSATVEATLDPCLVGQWRLATGTNSIVEPEGDTYVISGGSGTLRSVEADGTERFDFSDAAPYTGAAASGPVTALYRGTALGAISGSSGTATESVDYAGANVTLTIGGITQTGATISSTFEVPGTYSCTRTTWIDHSADEDQTWTRA